MDRISMGGRQGLVRTVRDRSLIGSNAALATLLGLTDSPTDGQIRALAGGIDLEAEDLALRLDLVCTSDHLDEDGTPVILAAQPEQLTTAEARVLLSDLVEHWRAVLAGREQMLSRLSVHVGSRGAHLLVDHGGAIAKALGEGPLRCVEPELLLNRPWQDAAPEGAAGELVAELMEASHACLREHEINRVRLDAGLLPVSMAWVSGLPEAGPAVCRRFEDMFGLRAAMVSRSPAALGLAHAMSIDRIALPEADTLTERLGTLGEYARGAVDRYDLVIIETSAVQDALLVGDPHGAIGALDLIDREVVLPLLARLEEEGDNESEPDRSGWRAMVVCDRMIDPDDRCPVDGMVPLAMCGSWVRSVVHGPFDEEEAAACDLRVERGADLMEYFLFSGLKRPRSTRRRDAARRTGSAGA